MQIYNDKKERIGILSGFRGRTVTTTLDSGDKELSFEYPANGKLADLLKEEYYIRTQTDEFVLKAVEKKERFNKYTAVLNVEELESTQFPWGFESKEQTIRACLEFAFEGTGWEVGTCVVEKRRTINEEENVSAWDVLQKCLSTYRCECIINSLKKKIDIYEMIGGYKGCYFMEGLNLQKLSLKSDTYDFYTRIYPIGKDGITPEWLLGKDYIDNFQYSKKVKAYVWKDERYTNTTSLVEDATAKLEELSRPYVAFTASVLDLAKGNPVYKDILSYSIGDTVDIISKKTRTKEKQRIVKIVEYPENPEKNTVELSNARKTFAEIQQEETETAKAEAIEVTKRNAKKLLEDYSTIEETEAKIAASKEAVEMGVMHTLEDYYGKTETDALINLAKGEIELKASETYQTKSDMGKYCTTKEAESLIDMSVEEVEIKVSEKLEKYSTAEEIQTEFEKVESKVDVMAGDIDLKVSRGDVSSQLSLETGGIDLRGNRVTIQSNNFNLTKTGEVDATGKFTSKTTDSSGNIYESILGDAGLRIKINGSESGRVTSGSVGNERGVALKSQGAVVITNGTAIGYIFNPNGTIQYEQRNILQGGTRVTSGLTVTELTFSGESAKLYGTSYDGSNAFASNGGFYAYGSIGCSGTKYRVVNTDDYGAVGMNALETPEAFFADVGSGLIGEDGKCYVFLEDVFAQTVDKNHDTYIQVTATSGKEVVVIEKNKNYFVVYGEEGAKFDWIIFAKQKQYEADRAERIDIPQKRIDYSDSVFANDDIAAYLSENYMEELDTDYEKLAYEYLDNYYEEVLNI